MLDTFLLYNNLPEIKQRFTYVVLLLELEFYGITYINRQRLYKILSDYLINLSKMKIWALSRINSQLWRENFLKIFGNIHGFSKKNYLDDWMKNCPKIPIIP